MNAFSRRPLVALALGLVTAAVAAHAGAALPQTLEARQAELKAISDEVAAWKKQVGPGVNAAISEVPEFVQHYQAIHAVELDEAERRAVLAEGHAALAPEKAAVFEAAAPAFTRMKQALSKYFASYDKYMDAEIRLRTYGAVLGALQRKQALAEVAPPEAMAKLEVAFDTLMRKELKYRAALADPASKNHDISNSSDAVFFGADDLDTLLLRFERKNGLAPKQPWGHRVGNFFRSIKRKARVAKIYGATLPAVGRMFTHLFVRPMFKKEPNPEKTARILRFLSKSYRWAAGMELDVKGADGIPTDAPVVFAFSHRSTQEDAVTMTSLVPGTYKFMWAARAMPNWLERRLSTQAGVIAVGGTNEDGSKVDAVEASIEALEQGHNLALFPEGDVPTPTKETRPLRSGIDVVTSEVSEKPVYIVPVTIDDPAAGVDAPARKRSHAEKLKLTVTVGHAIDPLKLKAVPGADRQLLLDVIRGVYHRNLYRPDVKLAPPACQDACRTESLGVVPDARSSKFQQVHGDG